MKDYKKITIFLGWVFVFILVLIVLGAFAAVISM
jgi:uncharacterized membrane protein